ncbi:hypothetical protein [Jannaschia marina]|uniref:hypothetical protein n=1 Tax=Jannaschia marina TaxID=2741674 RepID=UPI0015CD5140|nr:hypothetical protein [Jannaschia marina]
MKALLAAALIVLALPAGAHPTLNLATDIDTRYLWYDAPNTTDAGDARIRIVFNGHEGAAALTPNQYWAYSRAYQRHLAHLSFHQSVAQAIPRARHRAFRDVVARYPNLRVDGFDLKISYGDAFITPDL